MIMMKTLSVSTFAFLWASFTLCLVNAQSNTDCDVSANAMTGKFGVDIPRTCFDFRGQQRCFYTYVPECASGESPLVVDLHPYLNCPSQYAEYSGWLQLATTQCFVVMWPVGNTDPDVTPNICWAVPAGHAGVDRNDPTKETNSCCCVDFGAEDPLNPLNTEAIGDLEFLRESGSLVVDQVATNTANQVTIDTKKIYMTGHSNGCYASFGMAMQHSDFVAATACMSGLWVTPPDVSYSPVPMWSMHGIKDLVAPVTGYDIFGAYVPSLPRAYQDLSTLNNCTSSEQTTVRVPEMDLLFTRGEMVTRTSTGCERGATVEFVTLSTAGHVPFKGAPELFPIPPLAASTTVDTTLLAWNFLSSFSRDDVPPEFQPTANPTLAPTKRPTNKPTIAPTGSPTNRPTVLSTARPTTVPTPSPTPFPTNRPTKTPTNKPTATPTKAPSRAPTFRPTEAQQQGGGAPTEMPTNPSTSPPTVAPVASSQPMDSPTEETDIQQVDSFERGAVSSGVRLVPYAVTLLLPLLLILMV